MKNLKLLTIISFATVLSSCNTNQIQIKKDSGQTYDFNYREGKDQITNIARTEKKEDAWFFDGKTWHDVGINTGKAFPEIDTALLKELIKESDPANRKLLHNHSIYDGEGNKKLDYQPPSATDLSGNLGRERIGLKKGDEGAGDGLGTWTYFWTKTPLDKQDKIQKLNQYTQLRDNFMNKQRNEDKFDFKIAYSQLGREAHNLGIMIAYQH